MAKNNNEQKALEQDNINLATDNNALSEQIQMKEQQIQKLQSDIVQARSIVSQTAQLMTFVSEAVAKIDKQMREGKQYEAGYEVHAVLQVIANNQQGMDDILKLWGLK